VEIALDLYQKGSATAGLRTAAPRYAPASGGDPLHPLRGYPGPGRPWRQETLREGPQGPAARG